MTRSTFEKFKFHFRRKILRKPKFKGEAEIYEIRSGRLQNKKKDYFRRRITPDGEELYEFFYQDAETAPISYDYLMKRDDGTDLLQVMTPDYHIFVPFKYDFEGLLSSVAEASSPADVEEIEDGSDDGYEVGVYGDAKLWLKAASSELQRQANTIWQTDDEKWYEKDIWRAVIIFIAAGMFFVLYGYGLQQSFGGMMDQFGMQVEELGRIVKDAR